MLNAALDFHAPIAIAGHGSLSGYRGFNAWKEELMRRGITEDRIVGIEGSIVTINGKEMINTLSEMVAVAAYAKARGIRRVVGVAPEWHILRAFIGAATVAERDYPELKLYPYFGRQLRWDEGAVHSQGTLTGKRTDFIFAETVRIYEYHAKGDLMDPEKVIEYMDRRGA
ncbi:hypothetical protein H7X87_02300 [Acetobacteraceae bacterium]|nr:hypothetical protein [Candidatus Parcubacteria bacterium]